MMELTISGQVYQFNFGFGFLKEINKRVMMPVDGVPGLKREAGLRYKVAGMLDGSVDDLIEILEVANRGQEPRATRQILEDYVSDEATDIDQLFREVLDFLKNANCTKKVVTTILEQVAKAQEA